ncbi:MAG TPA: hypothetical protein VH437_12605 [Terriglobales bacterium]|jgi:hypothetical protein
MKRLAVFVVTVTMCISFGDFGSYKRSLAGHEGGGAAESRRNSLNLVAGAGGHGIQLSELGTYKTV